jgi:outer membrane murein-binding lipoprotein Lpp
VISKPSRKKANGKSREDNMNVVTNMASQAIRDKFTAEVKTLEAKLETLKAEAETVKADVEIKAITELLAKQREILHKLLGPRK